MTKARLSGPPPLESLAVVISTNHKSYRMQTVREKDNDYTEEEPVVSPLSCRSSGVFLQEVHLPYETAATTSGFGATVSKRKPLFEETRACSCTVPLAGSSIRHPAPKIRRESSYARQGNWCQRRSTHSPIPSTRICRSIT